MRIDKKFKSGEFGSKEKPDWLKVRPPSSDKFKAIRALISRQKLHTVCAEANCPNIAECWSSGTATFMILGDVCTRGCKFCNIKSGNPNGVVDKDEPRKLAESVKEMNLRYVVVTCVTRDDLEDGGALHFAECVREVKKLERAPLMELLISDLGGNFEALKTIIDAKPDVLAYNVETVRRLQGEVRDPRAGYDRSLWVLKTAKDIAKKNGIELYTKTSLMLGMGESKDEVIQTMKDLREIDVDFITFGQYLAPSEFHYPVKEYVSPKQFDEYKEIAMELGFLYCMSGPFVRSSYKAEQFFEDR